MRNNLLTKGIKVIFPRVKKIEKNENFETVKQFLLNRNFLKKLTRKEISGAEERGRYFAFWNIIELAYDIDTNSINNIKKQMPKVHDGHVRKNKIRKMKVNLTDCKPDSVIIHKTFNLY